MKSRRSCQLFTEFLFLTCMGVNFWRLTKLVLFYFLICLFINLKWSLSWKNDIFQSKAKLKDSCWISFFKWPHISCIYSTCCSHIITAPSSFIRSDIPISDLLQRVYWQWTTKHKSEAATEYYDIKLNLRKRIYLKDY